MQLLTLEYLGALFGVLGTLVLALHGPRAGWGFPAYLVSNAAWIVAAWRQDQWPLLAQQLVFMATSLLGIWVWLLKPALAAIDEVFEL